MHTPVFHNCYLLSVICPGLLLCKDILLFLKQANPNETDCNNTGMPVSPSSQPHPPTLFIHWYSAHLCAPCKQTRTHEHLCRYVATSPVGCWHVVSTYSLHSLGIIISTTEHRRHNEFPPSNRHTEDVKFFRVQSTDDRVQMALDWTDLHWWCIISLHLVGGSRGNMWAKHILHFISLQITISHHKSL
jgi:hypothetical protein